MSVVVALLGCTATDAGADRLPIKTIDECVAMALELNPRLHAADAAVDAGDERVLQAATAYLPQIEGFYSATRLQASPTAKTGIAISDATERIDFFSSGVGLSQVLFDFGQNLFAIRSAQAQAQVVAADRDGRGDQVVFEVKESYIGVVAARRLRLVANQTYEQTSQHVAQARGRFELGLAARFDVTETEVLQARAEMDQLTASRTEDLARETLRNAIGLDGPLGFDVVEQLLPPDLAVSEDDLVDLAWANRPEIAAAESKADAVKDAISGLKTNYLPQVAGNAQYFFAGTQYPLGENWYVGATVTLSIFDGGLTFTRIREQLAVLQEIEFDVKAIRQRVALEVRRAVVDLRNAQARLALATRTVTVARESLELAVGRYKTGLGNVTELTNAQLGLTGADTALVQAQYDVLRAIAALETLTSERLPGV